MKTKLLKTDLSTCVIYVRVSSKDQLEGFSLESQEKACKEFALRNGWKVLEVFIEEGESAKTAFRTSLTKMMKYCSKHKGKIGKLIIFKVDRFARNQEDYYALKVIFNRTGVSIVSATEPIDDSPIGRFMEGVLAASAEYDNNVRTERTVGGMIEALEQGYWPFKGGWGYVNVPASDSEHAMLIPDKFKAPIVPIVFEEYVKDIYTYKELAAKINKMGFRDREGKKIVMHDQLIVKILTNPIYYGKIEVEKWEISKLGKHLPLISESLFEKVQKVMRGETAHKQPRNLENPDFPLRGMKCGLCGSTMSGGWSKGKLGKRYAYYTCVNRKKCPGWKSVKKIDFENDFTKFLLSLSPKDTDLDILKDAVKLTYRREMAEVLKQNSLADSRIEKLKEQKDKLVEMGMKGVIKDDYLKQKLDELDQQIKDEEIAKADATDGTNVDGAVDFAFEVIKNLPKVWQALEVADLKGLKGLLFPENLSYHYPSFQTPTPAIIYTMNLALQEEKTDLVARVGTYIELGSVFFPSSRRWSNKNTSAQNNLPLNDSN